MKIIALIPAYNEEKTIAEIIHTLNNEPLIEKTVVVDDGSVDNTASVARRAGAMVVKMPENMGKGAAIQRGMESVECEILLLLDGDLIGLNSDHIQKLLQPLIDDQADMVVGVFNEGRGLTDLAQFVTPNLSGQRAIKVDILKNLKSLEKEGFGVEILLNKYVKKHGCLKFVNLPELTHVMKEEKMGFLRGLKARLRMYCDIIKTVLVGIFERIKK